MNPGTGFTVFFLLTLALLAGAVVTGRQARRKLHLPLVFLAVGSLAVAIVFAKDLGQVYDLESAGWITPVHLLVAKIATAACSCRSRRGSRP